MASQPQPPPPPIPPPVPPSVPPSAAVHDAERSDSIFGTLISAGIFLYVGFGMGMTGVSNSELYNFSVSAFTLGAKGVGIAFLVVAGLRLMGARFSAVLELMAEIIAALGCLVIGGVWVMHGDTSGFLLLLFGTWNAYVARGTLRLMRGRRAR